MRMTVKLRLALAFGVIVLLSAVTAGVGVFQLQGLNSTFGATLDGPVKRSLLAKEITADALRQARAEKNLILTSDKQDAARFESQISQAQDAYTKDIDQAISVATELVKPKWLQLRALADEHASMDAQIVEAVHQGKPDVARKITTGEGLANVNAQEAILTQITDINARFMADARAKADKNFEDARTLLVVFAVMSFLVAIGMAVWISLDIGRGLKRAGTLAQSVAGGDLTKTLENVSSDEIGDLMGHINDMVERLRTVVSEALAASDNVASGSQELSASAEQLSQGATEQAASGEEASSSMEQMAANIKQNADNASQTEKIARQSANDAQTSGEAVARAVDAMRTIAEKITIVQEIARQTDLLALNAAVEAARAGEHGKGFAVVASEVRKLAERSQTAAAEIGAVSSQTVKAAQEAGEMLTRLVPDIKKTADLVAEISAACREQDIGADQINQAIQQLDQVTQQNASSSEEMSATSEELAAQSEQLRASIAYFRIDDRASQSAWTRPVAAARPALSSQERPAAPRPAAAKAGGGAARPAKSAKSRSTAKAQGGGFAYDLVSGGPDGRDVEFERT